MFKPITICLGLRSTKASLFAKIVARSSQFGIALGTIALIIVTSVMNGFQQEMTDKFLSYTPHIELMPTKYAQAPSGNLPGKAAFKFYPLEAAVIYQGHFLPILLSASNQAKGLHELVVPTTLAAQFQMRNNAEIKVITPNSSGFFAIPQIKQLQIKHKSLPRAQSNYCYISLELATKLGLIDNATQPHMQIMLAEPMAAEQIATKLAERLPGWQVLSWQAKNMNFFQLIATQKSMMYLVLFLIVIIAAFGLISTQVMLVQERRSEIATLLTLGFAPNKLMLSYFIRGAAMGFVGLSLGLLFGILAAMHVTYLVQLIEQISGQPWLSHALYGMDHMPSKILASDLWQITGFGLTLCLLAPIYPAYIASRFDPIQLLRNQEAS